MRALCLVFALSGCVGVVSSTPDAGVDDAGQPDATVDAAVDAGDDGGVDAGEDAGLRLDAGPPLPRADGGTHPLDGGLPGWWHGHAANEWFPIPGTAGAGGAAIEDYSGLTLTPAGELVIAAAGGHGGSTDNRVVSIDLLAEDPAWVLRALPSSVTPPDVSHNPDGRPASRHTYQSTLFVPQLGRVLLVGCRFTWPGGVGYPTVDGFDLETNSWDPASTWPDSLRGYGMLVDGDGNVWTDGLARFTAATRTWDSPVQALRDANVRWPWAWDPVRRQLFGLNFGDGQGYGNPELLAERVPLSTMVAERVSFTSSPGLTQWLAEKPTYSGMDYDPLNDRFLFYSGQGTAAGEVYVVTPDASSTWSMSVLPLAVGSARPPAARDSGVNNRFRYVPQLKGFVLLARRDEPLWFLKL